jgi:glucokinase
MSDPKLLIGDIGGTNARFALANSTSPGFSNEVTLPCAEFESAEAAIRHYLESLGTSSPEVICLAVAGPIVNQTVQFTNNLWNIDASELAKSFGSRSVRLLNDFEAIAYSIPYLPSGQDLLDLDSFSVAIVGPGTGLGTSGLHKKGDVLVPIVSEASHKGFSPETQLQSAVLNILRERFSRVSVERLVSGRGIENLHWALGQLRWPEAKPLSAAEIFAAQDDDHAQEAVQLFFQVLGQYAGDIALAFGATDGVFIAGGIVRRYPAMFASSRFRSGFEDKGRYRAMMERIPTHLIAHPHPGLLGASYVALESFLGTEVMPTS